MKLQKYYFRLRSFVLTSLVRPLTTTLAATLAVLALALLALPPTSQADLVSYWNFDDGATVTDQAGSNDGTVIHVAGFNADTPDGSPFSLDLTATGRREENDYVRLGPAANGDGTPAGRDLGIAATNSFTIATWVNYTASQRGIISIKHDLTSGGDPAGDRSGITFGIGKLSGIGDPQSVFVGIIVSDVDDTNNPHQTFRDIIAEDQIVPFNEWHHMAVTYDFASDKLTTYLDGVASTSYRTDFRTDPIGVADGTNVTGGAGIDFTDAQGSFTGFGSSGEGPQSIARSAGDFTQQFYDGLIDDVGLWDNAISASAVMMLAMGANPPDVPIEPDGDFDSDSDVDGADFLGIQRNNPLLIPIWASKFGLAPGILAIPEPSSVVLAMLGLVGSMGRRSWAS